jgi:hypothetical protein
MVMPPAHPKRIPKRMGRRRRTADTVVASRGRDVCVVLRTRSPVLSCRAVTHGSPRLMESPRQGGGVGARAVRASAYVTGVGPLVADVAVS